jgi:hypothetical protein
LPPLDDPLKLLLPLVVIGDGIETVNARPGSGSAAETRND